MRSLAFSSGVHWTNVYLHMPSTLCVYVLAKLTVCVLSRQHCRHGLHTDEVLLDQSGDGGGVYGRLWLLPRLSPLGCYSDRHLMA